MSDASQILKKIVSKDCHWKLNLLQSWQEIVSISSSQVKIEAILDKTLVLGVAHPAVAHQMSISSNALLEKLKQVIPDSPIERLAFRIVDFVEKKIEKPLVNKPKEQQLTITNKIYQHSLVVRLSQKETQSLDTVYCQRLKQLLQDFYARCKKRKELNAKQANGKKASIAFVDSPYINTLGYS